MEEKSIMSLNDQPAYDGSGDEEDSWELIDNNDDETAPLAAPQNQNYHGATAAVPDNYIGEVTEIDVERGFRRPEGDAPGREDEGGEIGGASFVTAVSTIAVDDRQETGDVDAEEGGDDVDAAQGGEGDDSPAHKEEGQEDVLAAYFDEKLMRWVFPQEDAEGAAEPTPMANDRPPSAVPDKHACTTNPSAPLLTDDENTKESLSTARAEEDLHERAASGPGPAADPSEKTAEGGKSEISALVDSLADMGFERGLVEKTVEGLRLAGAKTIDHASVIDGMAAADSPGEDDEKSEHSQLVASLADMGFERELIERAIEVLHQEGAKEIDEDAIIEEIERQKHIDDGRPWDPFVEFSARDLRRQNRLLRRRTRRAARDVGLSAQEFWTHVRGESARFKADLKARCDDADLQERTARAAADLRRAATSTGDAICRANEEHRIAEKVATAAVVGGAALLALGNPRAGAGVIAAAGATLAAGEAMRRSSAHSGSTYTRDYGLREGSHID